MESQSQPPDDPTAHSGTDHHPTVHRYETHLSWDGSTGVGYDDYERAHHATAAGAEQALELSSHPAFRGDPRLLDPEQLLVLSASSCQLLSFLAIAARARLDVVSYRDDAVGLMPERDDRGTWITEIHLAPHIELRGDVPVAKVARLVELAHRECYIANSLRTEVIVEPTITCS